MTVDKTGLSGGGTLSLGSKQSLSFASIYCASLEEPSPILTGSMEDAVRASNVLKSSLRRGEILGDGSIVVTWGGGPGSA